PHRYVSHYRLELDICAGHPFFGDHPARICDVSCAHYFAPHRVETANWHTWDDRLIVDHSARRCFTKCYGGRVQILARWHCASRDHYFLELFFRLADCQI